LVQADPAAPIRRELSFDTLALAVAPSYVA
jgi:hypothetical protein